MVLRNIKVYTKEKKALLAQAVSERPERIQLAIISVGKNSASERYVRNKIKDCEEVGIIAHNYGYDEAIKTEELIGEINDLQEFYDGLIVQLPLPKHIDYNKVKLAINPEKDVDGFHPLSKFKPATPLGIMNYLKDCGVELRGKNVVIIGRSEIVGRPLARMMTDADATVTLCHSRTPDFWKFIGNAQIVICAVGKAHFLDCAKISDDTIVVDVGINFDENGKLIGDCYNIEGKEGTVTPVPGGVGLLTRVALLENLV